MRVRERDGGSFQEQLPATAGKNTTRRSSTIDVPKYRARRKLNKQRYYSTKIYVSSKTGSILHWKMDYATGGKHQNMGHEMAWASLPRGSQFWPAVLTVDLRGFDVVTKLLPSPSRLPGGLFRNSAAHKTDQKETDQQKTELMKSGGQNWF